MATKHRSGRVDFIVTPGGSLHGKMRVPGDKSISHRAVMLSSIAEGTTEIDGLLEGEDVLRTLAAFRGMGISIRGPERGRVAIAGGGLHGLRAPASALDMGNSGTAMRLLAGMLAAQSFDTTLVGDESLSQRPMARVAEPLRAMGAVITTGPGGRPPLRVGGGHPLRGLDYVLPVPSAQVKSALLLAGLYAEGATTITEPAITRDHTERMLRDFGYAVSTHGRAVRVQGGGRLRGCAVAVPADLSSAAFFIVGCCIAPGSDLVLERVGVNPTRIGVLNILRLMGADIEIVKAHTTHAEPVADVRVRGSALRGIVIPPDQVPLAIDEFPALFIAAACAEGETVLAGAPELRVKESDRIATMARGLKQLGIETRETEDGIVITGGVIGGGEIDSAGDHRIAMAFAMAGLRAREPIVIHDVKNVDTSFPGFVSHAQAAGLAIVAQAAP